MLNVDRLRSKRHLISSALDMNMNEMNERNGLDTFSCLTFYRFRSRFFNVYLKLNGLFVVVVFFSKLNSQHVYLVLSRVTSEKLQARLIHVNLN